MATANAATRLIRDLINTPNGGVNIKGAEGMRWMKKDMGGGAQAVGLARLIMAEKLPV